MPGPISLLPLLIPAGCVAKKSVPTAAVENSAAATPTTAAPPAEEAAPAPVPGLGTRTASTLLLYDAQINADFSAAMPLYAAFHLRGAASSSFRGLDDLVAQLKEYATIERLVIFTHGADGMLGIADDEANLIKMMFEDPGGVMVDQNTEPPTVYLTLENIASLFSGVAPRVTGSLEIDGCNVANWPSQMEVFRALFQAPAILGWNFYHLVNPKPLELTGNETADSIATMVKFSDVYLASGAPDPTSFAGQAGQFSTLYEWFRDSLDSTPPGLTADRKTFVPRDDADTLELEASAAAGMYQLNPEGFPVTRLTLVTIKGP
jgi:hypothetical protein